MARYQSYLICTSPRSGSTLLCGLLAGTKFAGNPGSHFHYPSLAEWLKSYDLNPRHFTTERGALRAIFMAAKKRGTKGTGIFGLRLQHKSVDFFLQQLKVLHPNHPCDSARIKAAFGETLFIHLTREDKLDQAISLVKASQTGLWHQAPDGTELERQSPPQRAVYDGDRIAAEIENLSAMDMAWEKWFEVEQISPLRMTYHALAKAPKAELARVIVGLDLRAEIAKNIMPSVTKLVNKTNQDWAARFLMEKRGRS